MKDNKFVQGLVGGLLGLVCAIITIMFMYPGQFFSSNNENSTKIKDDFYANINNKIIEDKTLDSDEEYWSLLLTDTQDSVDDRKAEIIKEIVKNEKDYDVNSDEYKICKLYNSILNRENDLSKVDKYIKSIDSSNSIGELINNISNINNELSLGILINTGLQNDYKDNSKTIITFAPFNFDYGINYSDYYNNPLYSSYVATYIEYDRKILELYGYSKQDAKESVRKISRFYAEIAKNSKNMEELSEMKSYYNIVSTNELKEIYNNININTFINKYGDYQINIVDKEQAKVLNKYFKESNLDTIKECAKLQLLQNYAPYGDIKYYNLMNELNAKLTGTDITKDTIEDYAVDMVSSYFDTTISKKYIEKYSNDKAIENFNNIIADIINEYKIKISNNTWLSNTTKQKALLKLENMTINVGYPNNWEEYSSQYELNSNLLNNIINMNKVITNYSNKAIINNEDYWLMSPLTVNAYYNPQDNSINFPIALLEYKLYNDNNSYYQNLGSLGSIIAHEITHAFDNNGALFDEKGNMNNWWINEDFKEFEKLQEQVISYYNEYKINGKSVNGKQTVSENIADLGAVSCIVDIAESKGATKDDYKELFESYSNVWASKATDEYTKLLMIMDTHSPDKIRVNAVLSSIEKFYDVFDIQESDGMYKEKEQRLKIW